MLNQKGFNTKKLEKFLSELSTALNKPDIRFITESFHQGYIDSLIEDCGDDPDEAYFCFTDDRRYPFNKETCTEAENEATEEQLWFELECEEIFSSVDQTYRFIPIIFINEYSGIFEPSFEDQIVEKQGMDVIQGKFLYSIEVHNQGRIVDKQTFEIVNEKGKYWIIPEMD